MRLCICACVVLGLTTLARAADQGVALPPAPALPTLAEPAHDAWSGVYIGVNAGYGGGRNPYTLQQQGRTASPYGTLSLQADGFVGGGQLGYNYVFGNGLLLGAETDFDAATVDDKIAASIGTVALTGGDHLDYLGTIRGRLGYAFGPVMVYGTGGFAYGGDTANLRIGTSAGSATRTHAGYAFGGGVAYAFADNVAVKAEFIQATLDSQQMADVTSGATRITMTHKPTVDLVRAGIDVHFASWTAPTPVVARY